jgi:hypothetical protein
MIERFARWSILCTETPSGTAVVGTHGGVISILRWHVGMEFSIDEALAEPMPAVYRFSPNDFVLR